jgi:hypothetical protein
MSRQENDDDEYVTATDDDSDGYRSSGQSRCVSDSELALIERPPSNRANQGWPFFFLVAFSARAPLALRPLNEGKARSATGQP